MNVIECPNCQSRLKVSEEAIGKKVRCGGCKSVFVAAPKVTMEYQAAPVEEQFTPASRPPVPNDPWGPGSSFQPASAPSQPESPLSAVFERHPAGYCVNHPEVAAAASCRRCGALVCSTCEFQIGGGNSYCPSCAMAPPSGMSSKRKALVIWSYILAVVATLGIGLTFLVAMQPQAGNQGVELVGIVFQLFVLLPALVGLALGVSVFDKKLHNPPALWGGPVWNGIILFGAVLLIIAGLMMGGA